MKRKNRQKPLKEGEQHSIRRGALHACEGEKGNLPGIDASLEAPYQGGENAQMSVRERPTRKGKKVALEEENKG